MQQILSVISGE